jgi:hypothetical protein
MHGKPSLKCEDRLRIEAALAKASRDVHNAETALERAIKEKKYSYEKVQGTVTKEKRALARKLVCELREHREKHGC